VKLLSFGADEEAEEGSEAVSVKKKAIVRPDRKASLIFQL
jgi:hypothetical protein